MLQVRKLVLAVAAATAFSSSLSHALGLGDLSVKSSLNQPLDAEISLLEVKDLTSIEIKTQLASPEEFSKAGVDRQFFLTGLKFTPVLSANGKSVIRVTSANPVKEPYLNFLVEVLWPNGRLLREFTILLDPPLYTPQQVVYAPQPAVISSTASVAGSTASKPQQVTQQAKRPVTQSQPSTAPTVAVQGSDYQVQKNDTLWEIAVRTGGDGSVHQTMLAIQDLNPEAFIGGNINRMKTGQVLRLPSAQDINKRSRAEAIAQVAQQNSSWKGETVAQTGAERQLDATRRSEAGAAPAAVEKADSLKLVADAPGQAQQAADQGSAANAQSLQDQLAVAKERLDSTTLENEDLKSRVEDLNSQLDKLQRLIELKDNQLAQLQNAVDAPVVEPVTQDVATGVELEAEIAAAEDVVPAAEIEPAIEPEQAAPVVEVEQPAVAAVEPEVEKPVAVPVPAPVVEEPGLLDQVMDDPMLLAAGGGAAVLVLLLGLMAVSRRNARKEAELYDEQLNEALPTDGNELTDHLNSDFLGDEPAADPFAQDGAFASEFDIEKVTTDNVFKEPTVDPLVEAESYISFGRFSQAAAVLSKAVDQEPQRVDLRLKLVEVYADLEDREGFSAQIQEISEIGGAAAELAQIKARYPQMVDAEQVDNLDFNSGFDDFNLDDLTLDLPTEVADKKEAEVSVELDDLSALLAETEADIKSAGSEFTLDLDLATQAPVEAVTNTDLADLSFDLSTDALETAAPQSAQNDFADLSLDDLELDLPTIKPELAADSTLDDFSFDTDSQLDSDFGAQLDEVNAELDSLTANLTDDALDLSLPADTLAAPAELEVAAAPLESSTTPVREFAELEGLDGLDGLDDDFGILAGTDETATKLDLARAYVDMGDAEGARDILDEVIAEGNPQQQNEARELIARLG